MDTKLETIKRKQTNKTLLFDYQNHHRNNYNHHFHFHHHTCSYFSFSGQVRVVIALTAMLVLTTLLNQVSANLPRNSYFKALDIWMFGAIGLIFSILILQTVADVLQRREAEAEAAKVGSVSLG